MFHLLGRSTLFASVLAVSLSACTMQVDSHPSTSEMESVGMLAVQTGQTDAVRKLEHWANAGDPVAQREYGLYLASTPQPSWTLVTHWLDRAALATDRQAQFELARVLQEGRPGVAPDLERAWKLYEAAADQGLGKASFMLARMAKYGQGVPRSLELSVTWLHKASEQHDAQAMYLLSNAYASGEGVARNVMLSRYWLTMSAENDYKVAIQALAMELDGLGGSDSPFSERSRQLLKEATDHRLMHWNTRL